MNELEKYYRDNYSTLVKRMYGRTGVIEDAEDIVQEAFARAIKYSKSAPKDFDRWFKVIASNCCRDLLSDKRSGGLTKNIDECHDELETIIPDHYGDMVIKEVTEIAYNKAGDYGRVLILNLTFGYTRKEISEITGLSSKAVGNFLARFTKEMKELYDEDSSIRRGSKRTSSG